MSLFCRIVVVGFMILAVKCSIQCIIRTPYPTSICLCQWKMNFIPWYVSMIILTVAKQFILLILYFWFLQCSPWPCPYLFTSTMTVINMNTFPVRRHFQAKITAIIYYEIFLQNKQKMLFLSFFYIFCSE